jgi:hypothetical protein
MDERVASHRSLDPRLGPEALRRGTSDRRADHAVPVALPRVSGGTKHHPFACAGLSDQDSHAAPTR